MNTSSGTTQHHLSAIHVWDYVGVIPEEELFSPFAVVSAACRIELIDLGFEDDAIKLGEVTVAEEGGVAVFHATMYADGDLIEFIVDVPRFDVEALTYLWDKFQQEVITALSLIAEPGQNPAITWHDSTVDLRLLGPDDEVQWEIEDVPASTLAVLFAIRASLHGGSPEVSYWDDRDAIELGGG